MSPLSIVKINNSLLREGELSLPTNRTNSSYVVIFISIQYRDNGDTGFRNVRNIFASIKVKMIRYKIIENHE